jgi:hypothetical protein
MKTSTYLIIGAILQLHLIAHLAVLECVLTHEIERVTVRQLSSTKLRELFGGRMQFDLGCSHRFHTFCDITSSQTCQEAEK